MVLVNPVYLEVVDYVLKKIHSGEWPVGHMIPTEMQLCEQFGLSRSTVRTAMSKLVQEGHLKRITGKGTFVTAPRVLTKSTVFIESFFEELAQQGVAVATDVLELRAIPADDEWAGYFDGEVKEMIKLTRLRYVQNSFDEGPISLTTTYVSGDKKFVLQHNFEKTSLKSVLKANGYRRDSMKKNITAINLSLRESRLLGVKEGSLAIKIISVGRDSKGRVIDVAECLYPVERNEFILEVQL